MRKMNGFGRLVRRARGNRRGGVLLEYVVLAVLLTTAVVVAVIYFGRTMNSSMATAAKASQGKTVDAQKQLTDVGRPTAENVDTKGTAHAKVVGVAPED